MCAVNWNKINNGPGTLPTFGWARESDVSCYTLQVVFCVCAVNWNKINNDPGTVPTSGWAGSLMYYVTGSRSTKAISTGGHLSLMDIT